MTLLCPICESEEFSIADCVECGPTQYADENTVQRAICGNCEQHFICLYSESRSFHPDRDDKVDHFAYPVEFKFWNDRSDAFRKPGRRVAGSEQILSAYDTVNEIRRAGISGAEILVSNRQGK